MISELDMAWFQMKGRKRREERGQEENEGSNISIQVITKRDRMWVGVCVQRGREISVVASVWYGVTQK